MKVSIVIPTYNAGHKLIRALMSVMSQTAWVNGHTYEILICDDGSTDLTLDIARQFLHVRILASETNTGGAECRTQPGNPGSHR